MKKLTRLGVIVLIIGVSLLFVTILRGSSPANIGSGGEDAPPDKWSLHPAFLLPPRDASIEIKANATIDVYVLDANGINAWQSEGTLEPRWVFENTKQEKFTIQIPERGHYAILTHNIQDTPTAIQVSLTLYGYEQDLIWGSAIFVAAGIIILIISLVKSRRPTVPVGQSSLKNR
jgi:hypothetical protein